MQEVKGGKVNSSMKGLVSPQRRKSDRRGAGTLASKADSSIHLLCNLTQVTEPLCSHLHYLKTRSLVVMRIKLG